MPIRAVVFDLFDTLVDLLHENLPPIEHDGVKLPASSHALHAIVADHAPIGFDEFTRAVSEGDRRFADTHYREGLEVSTQLRFTDLAARLGIEELELPIRLTEAHMGILRNEVRIPKHHAAVLDTLGARYRLALCSNFSHSDTALDILDEAGFRGRLDALVISDTMGVRKPRPEIFEAALEALGVAPEEAVHVGDSLRADVAGAKPLGIRTVWITRRIADPEAQRAKREDVVPDHTIHDLAELPDLLDELG